MSPDPSLHFSLLAPPGLQLAGSMWWLRTLTLPEALPSPQSGLGLLLSACPPLRALNPNVGAPDSGPVLSPPPSEGLGAGDDEVVSTEGAKDVNEPVKSPVTAVTTVAPTIKHGALTAPEIHLGRLSAAPAHHTFTCEPCTRLQRRARTRRLSEQCRGENGAPRGVVSAAPLSEGQGDWGPG